MFFLGSTGFGPASVQEKCPPNRVRNFVPTQEDAALTFRSILDFWKCRCTDSIHGRTIENDGARQAQVPCLRALACWSSGEQLPQQLPPASWKAAEHTDPAPQPGSEFEAGKQIIRCKGNGKCLSTTESRLLMRCKRPTGKAPCTCKKSLCLGACNHPCNITETHQNKETPHCF